MTTIEPTPEGLWYRPAARPAGAAFLLLHEAPGVTDNIRRRCARLAALGHIAFAPHLHGTDRYLAGPEAQAAVAAWQADPLAMRRRVGDCVDILVRGSGLPPGRVIILGYCFGGLAAIEFARGGGAVAAIASFHGLLQTIRPAEAGAMRTPLLVCTGGRDPLVAPAEVGRFHAEMAAAQADWRMIVYGDAYHSFTNEDAASFGNPGMRYHPLADGHAWDEAMALAAQSLR